MQNRAYSLITIKSVNEQDRIIEGMATTPSTDRMGDVVNPMGAKFSLPLPFLWQHDSEKPIGHVVEASPSPEGIWFRAQLAQTTEPGKLQEMLDFAWQAIKMKLVAAVSIGFRAIEYAFIEGGGIRFDEWDWFELSAVTIPAQAEATISTIKSIDAGLRKAAGIPDLEIPFAPKAAATGKVLPVVKLDEPVRVRTEPFVIRTIKPLRAAQR